MGADPWVIMPVLAHPTYTETAIADVLAQTRPCRLLVINQGVDDAFRDRLERIAEDHPRVFLWSHQPSLPSLAATWNRALQFAWETGAEHALVVNNDVRLAPNTLDLLAFACTSDDALLVSAVGVTKQQFQPGQLALLGQENNRGGPDFSCFLISRDCHERYPFDEHFSPAYCEDLDLHRRVMLAGDGHRIYSVNLPYLHYGAATLKAVEEKTRARIEHQIATISRTYYRQKWGGDVNEETFREPFGPEQTSHVTTPELQAGITWANVSTS